MDIDWGGVVEASVQGALAMIGGIFVESPWVLPMLLGIVVLAFLANGMKRRRR